YKISEGGLSVTIRINKADSWVVKGRATADLLHHEQGHYDIAALGARDFHTDLLMTEEESEEMLRAAVDRKAKYYQQGIRGLQDFYDEDPNSGTRHEDNANAQAKWDIRLRDAKNDPNANMYTLRLNPP